MKQIKTLTPEKFQDIFTDEKLRNQVASAHKCCDRDGNFKHLKTASYPIEYIVTEEQKEKAQIERDLAEIKSLEENRNKLLFVGMGMPCEAEGRSTLTNHRIRTTFLNNEGEKFLVEIIRTNQENKREYGYFDFAIHIGESDPFGYKKKYNYRGLERAGLYLMTEQNILNLINREFNCSFEELVIDNYNIGAICSENKHICESPQPEVISI